MPLTTLPDNLKPAVEKAAEAYYNSMWHRTPDEAWGKIDQSIRIMYCKDSEAAIIAFLNAAIEAGEAREAWLTQFPDMWRAESTVTKMLNDTPALILRMGDTND